VQWSDELVHWVKAKAPSDEPTVQFLDVLDELLEKKKRRQKRRMNRRSMVGTVGISDGLKKQDRDGPSQQLVAPDEPMV
jgi:hypothetical protein